MELPEALSIKELLILIGSLVIVFSLVTWFIANSVSGVPV